eukprot:1436030-Prymnesium_polylepis.1
MPSDDILWVTVQEDSVKQALYIAKLLRAAAKERVLLVDASEPRAGIFHKTSEPGGDSRGPGGAAVLTG